jgi:hypothetical protein
MGAVCSQGPRPWCYARLLWRTEHPPDRAATSHGSAVSTQHDKDTGMRNLPFKDLEHNRVRLALVLTAHDLTA